MKKRLKLFFIMLISFSILFIILQYLAEVGNFHAQDLEPQEINLILSDGVSEKDIKTLKEQTGFSENEIKEILKKENAPDVLKEYQKQNLTEYDVKCEYLFFPTTKGERLTDENGDYVRLKLPEVKTGDILITMSTHTFNFRHGHAGLVTDSETSEVLEAMMLGTNSLYNTLSAWRDFSTLAVLRVKNLSDEEILKVVEFAKANLYDVKYDFSAGLHDDKFEKNGDIKKTHCSHLVWRAYMSAGINLDSNGGKIVLPEDILKSDKVEIVWSYGINATK